MDNCFLSGCVRERVHGPWKPGTCLKAIALQTQGLCLPIPYQAAEGPMPRSHLPAAGLPDSSQDHLPFHKPAAQHLLIQVPPWPFLHDLFTHSCIHSMNAYGECSIVRPTVSIRVGPRIVPRCRTETAPPNVLCRH